MYYRGAAAAMLVYDITNPTSFQTIDSWVTELRDNAQVEVMCLLGNKTDLREDGDDSVTAKVCVAARTEQTTHCCISGGGSTTAVCWWVRLLFFAAVYTAALVAASPPIQTIHAAATMLLCAVAQLCCAVLCCAVLCCAVLCCAVLCCAVRIRAPVGKVQEAAESATHCTCWFIRSTACRAKPVNLAGGARVRRRHWGAVL